MLLLWMNQSRNSVFCKNKDTTILAHTHRHFGLYYIFIEFYNITDNNTNICENTQKHLVNDHNPFYVILYLILLLRHISKYNAHIELQITGWWWHLWLIGREDIIMLTCFNLNPREKWVFCCCWFLLLSFHFLGNESSISSLFVVICSLCYLQYRSST